MQPLAGAYGFRRQERLSLPPLQARQQAERRFRMVDTHRLAHALHLRRRDGNIAMLLEKHLFPFRHRPPQERPGIAGGHEPQAFAADKPERRRLAQHIATEDALGAVLAPQQGLAGGGSHADIRPLAAKETQQPDDISPLRGIGQQITHGRWLRTG
ncbi:MAG: hypothetical protein BGN83_02390 [Rhizobium sp. 63-7]|nr:MAG: hypothetical protein BGN83_02390 [Rhizobium sp. 63-7]